MKKYTLAITFLIGAVLFQAFPLFGAYNPVVVPASQIQSDWSQTSTSSADYIKNKGTFGSAYEGTTFRSTVFPVFKSATVTSGTAIFYLTVDGTASGTSIFPNGVIADSVNAFVNDSATSYQMAYAFSNGNKTLTVTANKYSGGVTGNLLNILNIVLGQTAANASVVKLSVWGY